MECGTKFREFLLFSCLFLSCTFQLSSQNESADANSEGTPDVIDFKVSVKRLKREVRTDPNEELSLLDGRTHRASEPLDPNQVVPIVNPFGEFDTVNTIFDPSIEGDDRGADENNNTKADDTPSPNNLVDTVTAAAGNRNEEQERSEEVADVNDDQGGIADVGNDDDDDGEDNDKAGDDDDEAGGDDNDDDHSRRDDDDAGDDDNGREYAAQYPYQTVTSNPYVSSRRDGGDPPRFYPGDLDYNGRSPYQRGVVEPYVSQSGNGNQRYPNSVPGRNDNNRGTPYSGSGSRMVVVGGSGNSGNSRYQSGSRPYVDNTRTRPEVRGQPYNGEVFVDSQGHYIDANGRHLDSTGRYYDMSGRFQDAIVTRTTNYYNSRPVYAHPAREAGNQYSQYQEAGTPSRSSPLDSYGGNQFYQTGSGRYPVSYDPVVSQISDDPDCPVMNTQVTINGLTCNNAITQLGSFVCYNYERVSTQCCQRCLSIKRREREGCEYGDRSNQCRNIQPFNCYDDRNRQLCCDRCRQFLEQRGQEVSIYNTREQLISRCSFDDLTPRCQNILERPHLCYLEDNQRLCCSSCPRLANRGSPECRWGDQSPEVCSPFDANRNLQVNCYIEAVRTICCATCKSLSDRMPQQIPGCQYGDQPTMFRTGRGLLNCGEFIRQYGSDQCNNRQTATKCCYTCHRYLNRGRQGK